MYNRDKTILYYSSMQQKDFIDNLNIHYVTFNKHLKNGTYYLGKYLFSREPILTAKAKEISILDLALTLEKDRVKYNKNKPRAPPPPTCYSRSMSPLPSIQLFELDRMEGGGWRGGVKPYNCSQGFLWQFNTLRRF
nr:hypothetical protein [Morchella crassipes]